MPNIGTGEIILLLLLALLLFGAKRLPDAARSLGRSMRILKAETKGLAEDDVAGKAEAPSGRQPLEGQVTPPPPPVTDPVERVRDK